MKSQEHAHDHGHPFRFEVRGRRFSSYTVMLYVGLVVALVVADALARRSGLSARRVLVAMMLLIPTALAGARALAVVLSWRHFRARRAELARMDRGGAAMYGGLVPAALLSVPLLLVLGVSFRAFWDVAAVAILAGMIPTRLGCLTNGCCAGRVMHGWLGRLGVPAWSARRWERRFPSPLAEAALAGVLLTAIVRSWSALPFPGAAFLLALGGYAAGRFALDWLRAERGPIRGGLGACQWISLLFLAACAVGLAAGALRAGTPVASAVQRLASTAAPDTLALVGSGLLLLPILNLFRFLGCDLVFNLEDREAVTQVVQLAAIVPPTAPVESFTATMSLLAEPGMTEIAGSPFELPPKAPLPDGSLVFESLVDVPEGAYTVSCRVASTVVASRIGTCSGELGAPGLAVIFFANTGTLPNVIVPIVCFEPPPA